MSAFAHAVRIGAYSTRCSEHLVDGTVNSTLSYVAQAFRSNNRNDPRLDAGGKTCFLLHEQWRAYKNQDGSRKKQKALPMMVLRKMLDLATSPWTIAATWLLIGAIFFAMRSCEYLETSSSESNKRTKILRMRNIVFKKKQGGIIPHSSPSLTEADMVVITFEYQKNDHRDVQVHMFKTDDPTLNPVVAWAKTVQRVWGYPGTTEDTKVCTFMKPDGAQNSIQSNQVRDWLRTIVELIGEDVLGFTKDDIGLHSIRSGGAMAMFLSKTSTIIIQRIGRWSSEAFLEYIREQVESFTIDVAQNMLAFEFFFNINRKSNTAATTEVEIDNENGPEMVLFDVSFSQLALNNDSALLTRTTTR